MLKKQLNTFKKRKGVEEDSLIFLLRALHGKRIVIELESNIEYNGVLVGVDENMMCSISDVYQRNMFLSPRTITHVEDTTILGKHIRYVHLPDGLDVMATMDKHIETITLATNKYKRGVRKAQPKPTPMRMIYNEAGECVQIISGASDANNTETSTTSRSTDEYGDFDMSRRVDLFASVDASEPGTTQDTGTQNAKNPTQTRPQ